MQTFVAYHFLQSLAFSLLNSLWQMALLWIIYNIITVLFSLKPVTHFRLLIATQAAGFLWFAYTFIKSFYNFNSIHYESNLVISNPFIQEKLLPLAAVIYLFFVFVFVAKFCIQFYNLKDIRSKELLPISAKWQTFINDAKTNFNIAKNVQINISKTIVTPLTIGFLKPIILIPIAAINQLSAQQLEAILLHELAHIKRSDYFINLLLVFVDAIMFFNPFSKCIYAAINTQRELCCDDTVLEYNYPNSLYAEALLNVAKSQLQTQNLFGTMTAVTTNQQQLKHRIKRILNIETESENNFLFAKQMAFTFLFGALLFVLIGFINTNVKSIVAESIPVEKSNLFVAKSVATNYQQNIVNEEKYTAKKKVKSFAVNKKDDNKIAAKIDYALLENRAIIEQGFQQIGKLATQDDITLASTKNNEDIDVEATENNNITLAPAIEKHPTTTVQKFFVPATSKSAASIIIVTTTEKENGKKVVKIEIEKGDSRIE